MARRKLSTHIDAEETRRNIVRTAQQLFMEYGYRAVSTRQIAAVCGLTQPALYHYFADGLRQGLLCDKEQGGVDALTSAHLFLNMVSAHLPQSGHTSNGQSEHTKRIMSDAEMAQQIVVFLDKLDEFRPKMFLIENVQGVQWAEPTQDMKVSHEQESLFPDIGVPARNVQEFLKQKAIKSLGYHVWSGVLDSVNFGVPQHRMRFFLFGVRSDLVPHKDMVNLSPYLDKLISNERISVTRAIGDLPTLENGQIWTECDYHPCDDEYVKKMRRYMVNGDLHDHVTTRHADYVIERYKKIPEGGNWKSIREDMSNYKKIDNTHSNIYRRLIGSEPANTISHYRKSMIIHPSQDRGLSFREACRLQSFPDWFRFQGTNNEKQQQLANAVPPLMASMVARAIGDLWIRMINENTIADSLRITNPDNALETVTG